MPEQIPQYGFREQPNPTRENMQRIIAALQDPRLSMAFPFAGAVTGPGRMGGNLFNLLGFSGGSMLRGPGTQASRNLYSTIDDIAKMEPWQQERVAQGVVKAIGGGFREANPWDLVRPQQAVNFSGGRVVDRDVWTRAINAAGGMNNPQVQRMLGFGQPSSDIDRAQFVVDQLRKLRPE